MMNRIDRGLSSTPKIYRSCSKHPAIAALILIFMSVAVCAASVSDQGAGLAPSPSSPLTYPSNLSAAKNATFESLESATLILTKPGQSSLIPYDERGFNQSVEASIAWWMNPKFMDNTSEFRRYLREPEAKRTEDYSPDTRIFFDFIASSLDAAEDKSPLNETLILFRGISPGFASSIINNSEYIEPGFASTSYDISVCLDTYTPKSVKGYDEVLVMQRSKGEHVLFINDNEREFLIPRGTRWAVIKVVSVEKLTAKADFTILGCDDKMGQFDKVRLIYVKEIES